MDDSNHSEYDFLNLWEDMSIKKNIIREEIIQFSDKINKINRYGFKQERIILLTDKAIYNIKKGSLSRRMDYKNIDCIIVAKLSEELAIHCKDVDYDYRIVSSRRKMIIEIISKCYKQINNKEIDLFEVEEKSLKEYVKTIKDIMKIKTKSTVSRHNSISVEQYLFGNMSKTDVSIIGSEQENSINEKKKAFNKMHTDLNDFEKLKTIGRGSVGKIYLVKYNSNNKLYVMKSMRKDQLITDKLVENIIVERNILLLNQCQFILDLSFYVQTSERVYFITPFIRGGDLFHKLKNDMFLSEELVKFYGAQIAIAIQHLHDLGFAYRDLKPENILIDEDGYLKLCDFGASIKIKGTQKEKNFAGSPEYAPPEIICYEGHTFMCDWWSFGILLYELLYGYTPFYNKDKNRMYDLIKNGSLSFPDSISIKGEYQKYKISEEAKDLISKLLEKDPGIRLGREGLKEVEKHPFFDGIKFSMITKKKIKAPFKPIINKDNGLENFDEEFLNMDIRESPVADWISDYQNKFDKLEWFGIEDEKKNESESDSSSDESSEESNSNDDE